MGTVVESATVIVRSMLLALIAVASAGHTSEAGDGGALVTEGEKWWTRSPDPRDPVACVTCHYGRDETRGWAASFPKFRPLPPPEGRVMTLLQANAEALRRHYGLDDPEQPAVAITAYLISRGIGVPVSPGIVAGQPTFESRLRALGESVGRGEKLFARRCDSCHAPSAVARTAFHFPRASAGVVESLERFLGRHRSERSPLGWDGQPTADIIAFLMSTLAGQPVGDVPARWP
jgi:mono/diheme cytochrome c family protein/cytochrome c553